MASDSGIVRTQSGRETYAPDGLLETASQPHPREASAATNGFSDTDTKVDDGYLDQEGKEAAEDGLDAKDSSSSEDGEYEPISPGDRETLKRLATQLSRSRSQYSQTRRNSTATAAGSALERQDTIAGLQLDDPVLDPNSPKFDLVSWRKYAATTCLDRDLTTPISTNTCA